ncbi:MAG: Hsp20/alpha crystallin family protein [Luteolibacter sp.]
MNTCNPPTDIKSPQPPVETTHRPQFRIMDDEHGSTVSIALPGARKEDLNLTLLEASLRIDATRRDACPEPGATYRDPAPATRYALHLRLGSRLDGTRTTASLDAGVLTLKVPVREEAKPRQIQVN